MTSQNPRLEFWLRQKEQFEQRAAEDSSAAWYWEIRCKIVRFLISRYGEHSGRLTKGPDTRRGEFEFRPVITKLPARRDFPLVPELKSPERIRVLLASIRHEVAAARQFEVE
jgi:hypothetical protein